MHLGQIQLKVNIITRAAYFGPTGINLFFAALEYQISNIAQFFGGVMNTRFLSNFFRSVLVVSIFFIGFTNMNPVLAAACTELLSI